MKHRTIKRSLQNHRYEIFEFEPNILGSVYKWSLENISDNKAATIEMKYLKNGYLFI